MPKLTLQPREKRVLIIGGIAAVLILGYSLAQGPLDKYRNAAQGVRDARLRVEEARALRDTILEERAAAEAIRRQIQQQRSQDLMVLVNGTLTDMKLLADNRGKYQSQQVFAGEDQEQLKVTLTGVTLEEIVNFLHRVYSSPNIIVTHSARIHPNEAGKGLNCEVVLLAPRM
jgi:type II secretory pathway component PulM